MVDMLQYLIIFLTSELLTRSAIHLIMPGSLLKPGKKREGTCKLWKGIIIGIKRNGDKTQMQSTHCNALGFMGIVQYKPYIVEQSCTGLSVKKLHHWKNN